VCVFVFGFQKGKPAPSDNPVKGASHQSDFSFLTSCLELKIDPQSVTLIRCPFSSQPSFAFCTGAECEGVASSVSVLTAPWGALKDWDGYRKAERGIGSTWLGAERWRTRFTMTETAWEGYTYPAQRRTSTIFTGSTSQGFVVSELFRVLDVVVLVCCVFALHRQGGSTALPLPIQTRKRRRVRAATRRP
jgi:hypothetical protein